MRYRQNGREELELVFIDNFSRSCAAKGSRELERLEGNYSQESILRLEKYYQVSISMDKDPMKRELII